MEIGTATGKDLFRVQLDRAISRHQSEKSCLVTLLPATGARTNRVTHRPRLARMNNVPLSETVIARQRYAWPLSQVDSFRYCVGGAG